MKSFLTISIFAAVLALSATTATAKSWRINSNTSQNANFASINDAMNSSDVVNGDTLYLDPGCGLSNQTVSKQVTIVGPGYLRKDAPYPSAVFTGDNLYIKAANTKIEGVVISANLRIQAQQVTVERCYINKPIIIGYSYTNAQYTTIRQCYILSDIEGQSANSSYCGYSTIENNIIVTSKGGSAGYGVLKGLPYSVIKNNYIQQTYTSSSYHGYVITGITNGTITNNILFNTGKAKNDVLYDINNTIVEKNVMSCTEGTYTYIGDNKCLDSQDLSLVLALQGTNDERYQLKTDSPAKGYATDGGDCGSFGGPYPYVLSGLPAGFPYYTNAVIGTRAKDGKINVSLNIKMQNE